MRFPAAMAFSLVLLAGSAFADESTPAPAAALVDRVVVRWHAPETGGVAHPQFIFERELAFEARLEAYTDPDPEPGYRERHVRAALDRHIAEGILSHLPILPEPGAKELAARTAVARGILEQRVRGRAHLLEAAKRELIIDSEVDAMIVRQARASLYLDRMVAPMLEPSELELRELLRTGTTPFKDQPYDQVAPALTKWFVGQRLGQAVEAYFQNVRSRVVILLVRATPPATK